MWIDPFIVLQEQQQEAQVSIQDIDYNEALIEEREQGVREIQQEIGQVNEMFQVKPPTTLDSRNPCVETQK